MKLFRQFIRLLQINWILARYGLDNLIVTFGWFAPFRFVVYLNPWNWFRKETLSHGEALRRALEELGPIFIKFGQALSTRPDLLPEDLALELSKLQDQVPPFDSKIACQIVEKTFKKNISDIFDTFDMTSLASASMAQVHAAKLKTGEEVVVKILRPNMLPIIQSDLGILKTLAWLADRYFPEIRRFKPKEIVLEFEQSLIDELDLQREAANASELRRNFLHSPMLYVPQVFWEYTRGNVFVMERIYGIPISDIEALKAHGINIRKLAERGVEIFFTQVFRDCFFHADMHPGNIFVSLQNPEDPQYICVDFGIMGSLSEHDKRYLAENLHAFFNRDYRKVALLHVESGWVSRNTRPEALEAAIRTVCEPIFEKPLKDISLGQLVLRLFQVARRYQMEVQPELVLLQKTLLAIEGLGRTLYPELDLWATAKPFLEKWMREQRGPKAFLHGIYENIPFFMEQLPHFPRLCYEALELWRDETIKKNIPILPPPSHFWRGWGVGFFSAFLVISSFVGAFFLLKI